MSAKRQKKNAPKAEEAREDAFIQSMTAGGAEPSNVDGDDDGDIDMLKNKRVSDVVRMFVEVNGLKKYSMQERVLCRDTMQIPTLSSSLIGELLQEPTTRLSSTGMHKVQPPACANGEACIGRSPDIPGLRQGSPRPLMGWMSQKEWDDMTTHGVLPAARRRCVLCESHHVQVNYNLIRLLAPESQSVDPGKYVLHEIQGFCVRVDENGGYKSKYCIPFASDGCTLAGAGIMCPIVMPQLTLMENKYSPGGIRYLCQRKLMHEFSENAVRYF